MELTMTIKLKYDNTNTFFIRGKNENILIDTGYAGTLQAFYKEIKKNNISLHKIAKFLRARTRSQRLPWWSSG